MKKINNHILTGSVSLSIILFSALLLILFMTAGKPSWPDEIVVHDPHAYATPAGAKTAAAFFTLKNGTQMDDKLISASSTIADITEIHENLVDPDDGKMMMRKVPALDVPAGKATKLDPKGYHIMFVNLKEPLVETELFTLTLNFEKAGLKEVDVVIAPIGGAKKSHKSHKDDDGHDHGAHWLMPKILILNGPNLNLLGTREPEIYGSDTLSDVKDRCIETAQKHNIDIDFRQSNHEGDLVTWIQEAIGVIDGIIINAAAYTHTSIAIHDALKMLNCPIIEVHFSDISSRESFRLHSYIEPLATKVIKGKGTQGYVEAIGTLAETLNPSW